MTLGSLPVHPWAGTSRATAGPGGGNILAGPAWGENFWILLLKMVHSGVLIFLTVGGAPNFTWPGKISPFLPPLSKGPARGRRWPSDVKMICWVLNRAFVSASTRFVCQFPRTASWRLFQHQRITPNTGCWCADVACCPTNTQRHGDKQTERQTDYTEKGNTRIRSQHHGHLFRVTQ